MSTYLPEEISEKILLKLPVKSLLRFRSVSKSWFSLISSTRFVNLQLRRVSSVPQIGDHKIMAWNGYRSCRSVDCDLSAPPRIVKTPFDIYRILGSTNGLVCVCCEYYERFYLWNPCTNEYNTIPVLNHPKHTKRGITHGFGYDSSTNDYKILVVLARNNFSDAMLNIFSSKRGTWRSFTDETFLRRYHRSIHHLNSRGVFLNGALHWLCWDCCGCGDDNGDVFILSFGLAEECFDKINVPFLVEPSCVQLSVLGSFLCLWRTSGVPDSVTVTVRIMKEYGLDSSWTILTTVPLANLDRQPYYPSSSGFISSLCYTTRGTIVFTNDVQELIETNSLRTSKGYCDITVYAETLVSPNISYET